MIRVFSLFLCLQSFLFLESKAQLLVGPVIGGEISKVFFFDDQPRYKSRPCFGYDFGFMASMRVRKNFVLNAQLLYTQENKHIVGTHDSRADSQFDLKAHMRYIELPIFYVLEFKRISGDATGQGGQTKTYNWFIGGGPVIKYWLSNKGTIKSSNLLEFNHLDHLNYTTVFNKDDNSLSSGSDFNKESISQPNRYQFGINLTGGVAFEPVGLNKIVASVHLNIAQTFLAKSDGHFAYSPDDIDVLRVKNHSIRFSLAYLLDTKLEKSKKGKSTANKGKGTVKNVKKKKRRG